MINLQSKINELRIIELGKSFLIEKHIHLNPLLRELDMLRNLSECHVTLRNKDRTIKFKGVIISSVFGILCERIHRITIKGGDYGFRSR